PRTLIRCAAAGGFFHAESNSSSKRALGAQPFRRFLSLLPLWPPKWEKLARASSRSTVPGGPSVSAQAPQQNLRIPREYNAASDFIDRNVLEGRGNKLALREAGRQTTYAQLAERVNRAGNALRSVGVQMEERVLLCLLDTVDFPALFFG